MTGHRHPSSWILLAWLLFAVGFLSAGSTLFGQTKPPPAQQTVSTKMSTQRSYYDAPNQDKVKIEITGDTTNIPVGLFITNAEIKYYSVAGGPPQLSAKTPDCILETAASQISSTNLLQARSGDGNFYVEGVGFLWRQKSTPDIILSNLVHTIIRQLGSLNGTPGKTNPTPSQTDVYSDYATFDTKSGLIIYLDHVRVVDPQLHLTSAILTVQLTQGGAPNQLDHIVAETNVIMDFIDENGRTTHATSEKAVYTRITEPATNELLTLSINPRLETTNGWATADVFVMNRTTGKIHGTGNCHFFHSDATNNLAGPGTVITSDDFDYDRNTGLAVFRQNVRVDNPQIKLVCDTLTASLSQGDARTNNELNNIIAEDNVAIDYLDAQGEKTHATAEKAVYNSSVISGVTNKVLDLTGNPVLERTNGWIMADLISMNSVNGTIRGEGNHHTIFKKQPGQVSKSAPPAASDTEIFSDHFDFNRSTGLAFYRGNARVLDPQMRLQCRQLTVKLPENSDPTNRIVRPERIVAETNVIVDYFTEKGEKTHATGEKMVFTHTVANKNTTNEVLELTGNPLIDMTNPKGEITHAIGDKVVYTSITGISQPSELVRLLGHPRVERSDGTMTSDEIIIYDRITGSVHGVGPHNYIHFILKPGTSADTNHPPALSAAPPF